MTNEETLVHPNNHFQVLIEIATSPPLPRTLNQERLREIVLMIPHRQTQAAAAYQDYMSGVAEAHRLEDLMAVAAWIASEAVSLPEDARLAGAALNQALVEVRALESNDGRTDGLQAAERHLETIRSLIRNNSKPWKLLRLRNILRAYRVLSLEAMRAASN